MTTQDTPEVLDNDEHSPSGLRATIERLQESNKEKDAELAAFRAKERAEILEKAGLDPVARKAIAKDIERGDFDGELSVEAVQEYAQAEYEWTPPADNEDPPPTVPEDVAKRMESQRARDDLNAASQPRGERDDSPEADQAKVDEQLDAGDIKGAIFTELTSKVGRAT